MAVCFITSQQEGPGVVEFLLCPCVASRLELDWVVLYILDKEILSKRYKDLFVIDFLLFPNNIYHISLQSSIIIGLLGVDIKLLDLKLAIT